MYDWLIYEAYTHIHTTTTLFNTGVDPISNVVNKLLLYGGRLG